MTIKDLWMVTGGIDIEVCLQGEEGYQVVDVDKITVASLDADPIYKAKIIYMEPINKVRIRVLIKEG